MFSEVREFTLSRTWRIVTYVSCLGLLALSAFLVSLMISEPFRPVHVFFGVLAFGFTFLAYYAFQDARIGKIIILEDRITLVGPFGKRTLLFDDIKGYRKEENYHVLEPENPKQKKIRISTYLAGQDDIRDFLDICFDNLDDSESIEEENEIYTNEEFGITEEARWRRLENALKVAKWANRIAWVITLWTIFYPHPHYAAMTTAIVYPLIALTICYNYRGLMKGGDDEKSVYPSVAEAFILPGIALALRAVLDINTIDYSNGWLIIIIFTIGFFILYQIPTGGFRPGKKSRYVFLALFPLFTFFYSLGLVVTLNKIADNSSPREFITTVVKKEIDSGKVRTYHLILAPWGSLSENEKVKVSYEKFSNTDEKDSVNVFQYRGYLGMPWVEMGE